jgi:hypothetical protein
MSTRETYYKAARPDGTDFRTGTIHYRVGETVRHPDDGLMRPNHPSTYLSVSVELGEVLTGGSWPCCLFRVEPVGDTVTRTDGQCPFKRGCKALWVAEELPAHLALGPNGEAVAALIDRAGRLTSDDARGLAAARVAAWAAAWGAARGAARDAAWDVARVAAWDAARVAAWDAARALLVQDVIAQEHFDILYGPWASVIDTVRAPMP